MSFRFANGHFVRVGLVLACIFVFFTAGHLAHGADDAQSARSAQTESRLGPKRFFSSLKRRISGLFRKQQKTTEQEERQTSSQTPPQGAVAAEIEAFYRHKAAQSPALRNRALQDRALQDRNVPGVALPSQINPPRLASHGNRSRRSLPNLVDDDAWDRPSLPSEGNRVRNVARVAAPTKPAATRPSKTTRLVRRTPSIKQVSYPQIASLNGYCVVNLKDGRFMKGKREFRAVYQGRTYYFDSAAAKKMFQQNPALYAPALQGNDVVELDRTGRQVKGFLSLGCDYKGKFYLFTNEKTQERFLANPANYAVGG